MIRRSHDHIDLARILRAAIICCRIARNLAYYWETDKVFCSMPQGTFWNVALGNFIDIAILDWCILFGSDHKDHQKHHWKRILPLADHENFKNEIDYILEQNNKKWDDHWKEITNYRNRFVAHLDDNDDTPFPVPDMGVPHVILLSYYFRLQRLAPQVFENPNIPCDLGNYFVEKVNEAKSEIHMHIAAKT
jgi:hypothetical protein